MHIKIRLIINRPYMMLNDINLNIMQQCKVNKLLCNKMSLMLELLWLIRPKKEKNRKLHTPRQILREKINKDFNPNNK